MRSVVGGNNIELATPYGLSQGLSILKGFDGRVPLDAGAQSFVVLIRKPKVMNTYFSRDVLALVQ